MKIDIITLFPDMFTGPFDASIIKRAKERGLVEINIHNLRNWTKDKHKTVDDRPYGGGAGMLLKVEPIDRALDALKRKTKSEERKIILLDPGGKKYDQVAAEKLSRLDNLILICGHYEGVDHRIREHLIDEELSVGDYILTGGEIPAMVIVDTVTRLIPGVLEKVEATQSESFSSLSTNHPSPTTLLEHPQYTRPENFKGWKVPQVLLSGNHKEIEKWKKTQAMQRTKNNRPDLL